MFEITLEKVNSEHVVCAARIECCRKCLGIIEGYKVKNLCELICRIHALLSLHFVEKPLEIAIFLQKHGAQPLPAPPFNPVILIVAFIDDDFALNGG